MEITELFILVPALLGLKGNLDMTLAARLSTQANLGNMKSRKEIVHMVVGNISLVQVQAIVASFIVSIFSLGVGFAFSGEFYWSHAFLLTASSMFTATVSCFVLGKYRFIIVVSQSLFMIEKCTKKKRIKFLSYHKSRDSHAKIICRPVTFHR